MYVDRLGKTKLTKKAWRYEIISCSMCRTCAVLKYLAQCRQRLALIQWVLYLWFGDKENYNENKEVSHNGQK